MISTGYFGRATEKGHNAMTTQVHVYNGKTGRCLCGYKPHKTMQFMWCANDAQVEYIECGNCLEKVAESLIADNKKRELIISNKKTPEGKFRMYETKLKNLFDEMAKDKVKLNVVIGGKARLPQWWLLDNDKRKSLIAG